MAIKKEREAFLNVYVNYKGDSRKIQFNEETEQFMWRKNNVSDTEVEYVHLMNQRWYAWLACAKSKAQAVPEWISVEDRLPSDGQNIIAFDAIKHCVFKDGEFLQGYFEPDTGHEYTEPVDVTHWIAIEPQEPTND